MTKENIKNYFIASCYVIGGLAFAFVELYPIIHKDKETKLQTITSIVTAIFFALGGLLVLGTTYASTRSNQTRSLEWAHKNNATTFLIGSASLTVGGIENLFYKNSLGRQLTVSAGGLFTLGSASLLFFQFLKVEKNKKIADIAALVFFGLGSAIFLANTVMQNYDKYNALLPLMELVACVSYSAASTTNILHRIFSSQNAGRLLTHDNEREFRNYTNVTSEQSL